jgi:type II secretory pathway pseudopilin PulG
MFTRARSSQAGFSFIELIFVAALSVIVFGALFSSFQYTLELIAQSRAKLSALSLATERIEFFRSLPYDEVGTLTGVINGPVANNQTLTLNGIDFTERIVIDYVDGLGDGVGGADGNGITQDYKQIKLEYSWDIRGETNSVALVTNIMPRSIESDVGGGSIRVVVLDQDSMPLPGARVQISNASSTAPLYESRISNGSGEVLLSGVPVDSNYEVIVGGPIGGATYSTSSTYIPDANVPNPTSLAFPVSEAGVATKTFIIDEVSDINLTTLSAISEGSAVFPFADSSGIATSTDTAVSGGDLVLADAAGVYESTGETYLTTIAPTTLESWETLKVAADLDPGTDYVVRLYTGTAASGYSPIPDSELSGNAIGFTDALIDISGLDVGAYPTTTVGVTLTTSDPTVTPEITEIAVFWRESATARAGQTLFVRGDKLLGTDAGGGAIYKSTSTVTTDAAGEIQLPGMEFDRYTATTSSAFDLAAACPAHPFLHRAGFDSDIELLYVPSAAQNLRVIVQDSLGRAVPGAEVRLNRAGYDVTQVTNTCGQTFFTGGVAAETDYDLTVTVPGYASEVVTPFSISGNTVVDINLAP